ncbi:hypothetical protein D3C87_2042250 [compost metagenome]
MSRFRAAGSRASSLMALLAVPMIAVSVNAPAPRPAVKPASKWKTAFISRIEPSAVAHSTTDSNTSFRVPRLRLPKNSGPLLNPTA